LLSGGSEAVCFIMCDWNAHSAFWIIRLTNIWQYIWDTSVVEFHNANFLRCGYVYMKRLGILMKGASLVLWLVTRR
jgi:hypothetical protein